MLERLEDRFDYRVESVAHKGDTVEEMAYDTTQLAKLARLFEKVKADSTTPVPGKEQICFFCVDTRHRAEQNAASFDT